MWISVGDERWKCDKAIDGSIVKNEDRCMELILNWLHKRKQRKPKEKLH